MITPVSEAGSEAYLIEFCQFDPKQLSRIVNKENKAVVYTNKSMQGNKMPYI